MAAGHQPRGGVGGVAPTGGDGDPGARAAEREHDGPRRATGAGDEHVGPRGVEALVAHRAEEALAVGRRSREPAVVAHGDHVDRAERAGVGRELVARPRGVGLVRHRDGEPGEAEGARRLHRVAAPPRRHREREVDPVQAGFPVRGVEDRGRTRVRDRVADEPGDPGLAVERHSPRTPWARMFASCSASVVAKYVTPSLPVT